MILVDWLSSSNTIDCSSFAMYHGVWAQNSHGEFFAPHHVQNNSFILRINVAESALNC